MNLNLIENYLYTRKLDLDLVSTKESVSVLYEYVKHRFGDGEDFNGQSQLAKELYGKYNLFMYPLPEIHKLYREIRDTFHAANSHMCSEEPYDDYFIQGWINYYHTGEYINWHGHWRPEHKTWHGFFCLETEPNSHTTYKIPNYNKDIDVVSENNLLVLGPSDGDLHRSSDWNNTYPRITLAFDIIPAESLRDAGFHLNTNHWVPI
jgi:hypothetical protein